MTLAPRKARTSAVEARRRKGDRTRTAILEAAERLMSQTGYQNTSLQAVADAVGISQPGLLYHFRSKEALLLGVLAEREEDGVDQTSHGLAVIDELQRLFRDSLANPQLVRLFTLIAVEGLTEDHPAQLFVRNRYEDVHHDLATRLRHGQQLGEVRSDADIDQTIALLTAAMDGLSIQWLLDPQLDVAAAFDRMAELVRHAVSTATQARREVDEVRDTKRVP